MSRKRFKPEEIVNKLREADVLLSQGTSARFGYVGAFGYQTHDEMPFLHVGARCYDPSTGRFLQRDPIGIIAGKNVYAYVKNRPASSVDPSGLVDQNWEPPWGVPPKLAKPKPKTSYSIKEMQEQLKSEERLQALCYAGLLAIGGWEAYVTQSIIGGALNLAGWLGWAWTYL